MHRSEGDQCVGSGMEIKALTHSQAFLAASLVAARVQGSNLREWRAYNTEAESAHWPGNDSPRKVLVLPGSRNEVYGHPDWSIKEINRTDSFQSALTDMQVSPGEVVVRCHPNWGEDIWGTNGRRIESFYTDWATGSGYTVISSAAKASTIELIKQADVVVVSGGSAALEAAL